MLRRALAPAVLVLAAALSLYGGDSTCLERAREMSIDAVHYEQDPSLWPPGPRCTYLTRTGSRVTTEPDEARLWFLIAGVAVCLLLLLPDLPGLRRTRWGHPPGSSEQY